MSDLVYVRLDKNRSVRCADGSQTHYVEGGDYNIPEDLALEFVADGAEDINGVLFTEEPPPEPEPEPEDEPDLDQPYVSTPYGDEE